MCRKYRTLTAILGFLLLVGLSFEVSHAQSASLPQPMRPPGFKPPDFIAANNEARQRFERQLPRRSGDLPTGSRIPTSPSSLYLKANGKAFSRKELSAMKKRAEPDAADLEKYHEFLSGPKTGIFKIFPDIGCVSNFVVNFDERCAGYVIGGSMFSFRKNEHLESIVYDIRLGDKDDLIADGFLNQSIIVPLGNIDLASVTASTVGLEMLNRLQPKTDLAEARKQFQETAGTIRVGKFSYSKRVLTVVGNTYALRCAAYAIPAKAELPNQILSGPEHFMWSLVASDPRLDLTLAFTVVKRADDGSFTIIWKELARGDAPLMKLSSIENISDLQ